MTSRIVGGLILLLALGGCGGVGAVGSEDFDDDVQALAKSGQPVYFVGDAVAGLPLTHVERGPTGHATFVYGECNGEGRGDNFVCRGPQVQIQNWPLAERHPLMFMLTPTRAAACRRETVRDVPAATFETSGGALEIYAGRVVVVIFARPELAADAADALRLVHEGGGGASTLPHPPPDVVRALRRCAVDPPAAKLRELERTAAAPVYWLGDTFAGHPLARVEGEGARTRFVYGACALRENFERGTGCWPPLDVEVQPIEDAHPGAYSESITCTWSDERGAVVASLPSAHTLHLFAGRRTIALVGPDLRLLRRAVGALRSLDGTIAPLERLKPPPAEIRRSLADRCSRS